MGINDLGKGHGVILDPYDSDLEVTQELTDQGREVMEDRILGKDRDLEAEDEDLGDDEVEVEVEVSHTFRGGRGLEVRREDRQ